ncbi:AAA family ATPase [Pseudofrankia sp. BMG5.37]|uniref:ATP-binding protein n=1 Tax=Pseudofrankia sp. BMG5.37 TaxID=3050035 RepID=UPI002895B536|nr:AAA family ATPase [Pseudofrankia sp. BMG5.37]MDT3443899.1 AAA family ATPase [Pseudofrankia sp. BMG5.37]
MRDAPTVGRAAELAGAYGLVDGVARRGEGALLAVVGEAGVGKSRILDEVAARARAAGTRVFTGRAVPGGGTYRAIAEALVGGLRDDRYPAADELRPYRAALGRVLPGWAPVESGDRPDLTVDPTLLLGEGVLRLLRQLGGDRGCLLVLEDLHWADADTWAVVEYLAGTLAGWPLLVAVSARDDEDEAVPGLVRRLGRQPAVTTMRLGRLDAATVAALAAACAGDALSDRALRYVLEKSDGLPFLVEELVAAVAAEGVTEDAAEGVAREPAESLPHTLADLVAHRLSALTARQRRVVEAAAVLGAGRDWALLGPLLGLTDAEVLDALRAAHPRLLVSDGATLRWRHALTRDAVLASLLPPERAALARRVAQGLRTSGRSDDEARAGDLLVSADEPDEAAAIFLRLARRDLARAAPRSAEELLARAAATGARPAEVAIERARLLTLSGRALEALDAGAAALATVTGDRHADLCLVMADAAVVAGRWAEAERLVERAGRAHEPGSLALAADAAFGGGDPRRAARLADEAVTRAARGGDWTALVHASTTLARCTAREDPDAALAAFRRAAAIAAEHGLTRLRVTALIGVSTVEFFDRASSPALLEARDVALDAGLLAQAISADLMLADGRSTAEGPRAAEDLARHAADQAHRLRLSALRGLAEIFVATGRAAAGDTRGMEVVLTAAVGRSDTSPEVAALAPAVRGLRRVLAHDLRGATALFDTSIELLGEHASAAPVHIWGLWALLRTVTADRDAASRDLLRRSDALPRSLNRGGLRYAEAVASGRDGEPERAAALFDSADAILAEQHWWRRLLRLLALEAAVADGWGTPVPALRADLDAHVAGGDDLLARTCRDLLRRAGAPTRRGRGRGTVPPRLRALGVTSREMDVLGLLVDGLTNREIAERLFVSPRTVDTHVASLLAKTGAPDRIRLRARLSGQLADTRPPPR